MKRCTACGRPIDVRIHPYANVYPVVQSNPEAYRMESYHLQCLVQKIRKETMEAMA